MNINFITTDLKSQALSPEGRGVMYLSCTKSHQTFDDIIMAKARKIGLVEKLNIHKVDPATRK